MQNAACYNPSAESCFPTKHRHATLSTWRKVENRGNTVNTSSHNTPAVDLDTHYGFLFKKKNNPNRIIRHHSHLCFPSLQGGKEENTTSVCFSTGKDTETYQLLKKKFHGRNSREWYFPGAPITCRDGARTQSSKSHKIWRIHTIISENIIPKLKLQTHPCISLNHLKIYFLKEYPSSTH